MSIAFDSRKNYLKQYLQGSASMGKPSTLDAPFDEYFTEYTIEHNLGYEPLVRAWYDPDGSGRLYPAEGQKFFAASIFYYEGDVDFLFYPTEITTTSVTFRASRLAPDGALSGSFTFYYKIYLDPVAP